MMASPSAADRSSPEAPSATPPTSVPGRAVVMLSPDLIRDLLHMPETASLIDAWLSGDGHHFEILVKSPDLPNDGTIRTITPRVTHHAERFEWSWGIDPADGEAR